MDADRLKTRQLHNIAAYLAYAEHPASSPRAANTESFPVCATTRKASVRRVRPPHPCEEDAHAPMGSKSPAFKGRASPLTRDLCNIREKTNQVFSICTFVRQVRHAELRAGLLGIRSREAHRRSTTEQARTRLLPGTIPAGDRIFEGTRSPFRNGDHRSGLDRHRNPECLICRPPSI